MVWQWLLRPEPEPEADGVLTFRLNLILLLALVSLYGYPLFFFWLPSDGFSFNKGVPIIVAGMLCGVLALWLRPRWPWRVSLCLLSSNLALLNLFALCFGRPILQTATAIICLAAVPLLGIVPGALLVTASAFVSIRVDVALGLTDNAVFWGILCPVTWLIGVVIHRALLMSDYWQKRVGAQRQLTERLRDRQGELNRTLKALEEAYGLLKRSNDELRVARAQAEQARALKEQFVARVSHELRTPLNLIVGFAEIMYLAPETYRGATWTPELESDIGEIYQASRHLQSLINDILDLSRISAERLPLFRELQDLRPVIDEAAKTLSSLFKQRGLLYRAILPETLPKLFIDRTRIRQVMINLLNNALRFTDQGEITVTVDQTAEAVIVSVRDTGIGIPADELDHIFEEFRGADGSMSTRGGAGLGLTISRQFVELHGGRMWAESRLGEGSTFFFTLPLPGAPRQSVPLKVTPERMMPHIPKAPIVVVDPDPSVAEMLSRYIGDRRTLAVDTLEEAETLIEAEHPAAIVVNHPPDAPWDTWLAASGIGKEHQSVPVLQCSLPSSSWLRKEGFEAALTKPISRDTLVRLINRYCPKPWKLLVIDDDPGFSTLVTRMLSTAPGGGKVMTACSGMHGLRLARQEVPDLILIDILMPQMNGLAVAQALRSDPVLGDVPLVAVSAGNFVEDTSQELGQHFVLTRPDGIPAGTVVELINVALQIVQPGYAPAERT